MSILLHITEEGTLEQFEECEKKVKSKMINVMSKRKEERKGNDSKKKDGFKISPVGGKNAPIKDKSNKRKKQDHELNLQGGSEPVFKKPNFSLSGGKIFENSPNHADSRNSKNGNAIAPPPGFKKVLPPPGYQKNTGNIETSNSSLTKNQKSETTIFVSNLNFQRVRHITEI